MMTAEERAARVAHRFLSPTDSYELFCRLLEDQRRPMWNKAVALIADAIRDACKGERERIAEIVEDLVGEWDSSCGTLADFLDPSRSMWPTVCGEPDDPGWTT